MAKRDTQRSNKGGGKEGQALDWWKKKKEKKAKVNANVTEEKGSKDDEPENYAMAAFNLPNNPEALVCTSGYLSEAHVISHQTESIIDSGASHLFSPEQLKFLNYKEFVNSEPICAADGGTFSAFGKGDLKMGIKGLLQLCSKMCSIHLIWCSHSYLYVVSLELASPYLLRVEIPLDTV